MFLVPRVLCQRMICPRYLMSFCLRDTSRTRRRSALLYNPSVEIKINLNVKLCHNNLLSLVPNVKKAVLEKWSLAGDKFSLSTSSNLLISDKAIVSLLKRTLNAANDCILARGQTKDKREKFLKDSSNLFNILHCK